MGQFSWFTQDTKEPIYSDWDKQIVHMVDPRDGTDYIERDYEGYGVFCGRDFYELLADINKDIIRQYFKEMLTSHMGGILSDIIMDKKYRDLNDEELRKKRGLGINIWFAFINPDPFLVNKLPDNIKILSPILVSDYNSWEKYKGLYPEDDPNQGWHMIEEEEDEDIF